jgi:hypothetical protein
MADITVSTFTIKSAVNLDTIIVSTYGDGNFIREDLYSLKAFTVSQAETDALFAADAFGILDKGNQNFYKKQQPQQPITQPEPPPPAPTPVTKNVRFKRYIPKSKYTEPKYTPGGEFVNKNTQQDYTGYYIETYRDRFYAGKSPQQAGDEIEKIKSEGIVNKGAVASLFPLLIALSKGFFKPSASSVDKDNGFTTRYFVQDKNNNKITETDKSTYLQAQDQIPNQRFATADWIIKGPAENKIINGYPFEGAASKNKKTIQALETQMPGISTFVTDYSLLVEEPVDPKQNQLYSDTVRVEDPIIELENSRKANFDQRK